MEEQKFSSLMISLDELMDTRLAALAVMGEETMKKVFSLKHQYFERLIDLFPGIDNQRFLEIYSNRDKRLLQKTGVTRLKGLLQEFAEKTSQQVLSTPFHYQPRIILNIHPYVLTENEIKVLIQTVRSITKNLADIEVVDMHYKQITPSYVKKELSVIVMYEYYKWLDYFSANEYFKKVSCPEVAMIGPAIYFTKPKQIDIDPFKDMQELAKPFIGLKLLPIENFSILAKSKA